LFCKPHISALLVDNRRRSPVGEADARARSPDLDRLPHVRAVY